MSFDKLGLKPQMVARLKEQGITEPTPIQRQAIPHAMNGRDVLGLAQTGTGKTAAFGLPLLHAIMGAGEAPLPKAAHGLILAPTRELARQIHDTLEVFTKGSHLKMVLVTGGASLNRQTGVLKRGADVLIATPGRLIDLMDRKAVRLDQTRFLVLDEADQMLDIGFIHALRRIAKLLPKARQTMLFSATMPRAMDELAADYLSDPVRVEVARPGVAAERIAQSVHFVEKSDKLALLQELLDNDDGRRALVFARTKHGAERLMKQLRAAGHATDSIHGNKSQGQRDRAIRTFRSGDIRLLVATDVAARGIDIPEVGAVYNFDLPNVAENYVHRIGRTARAGAAGNAVAFCAPEETDALNAIERVLKEKIAIAGGQRWDVPKPERKSRTRNRRRSRRGMARAA